MIRSTYFPDTEELNKEVGGESCSQHLTDDENVTGQRTFKHDRHVASVEELHGITSALASESVTFDRNFDSETLKVDNDGKDYHSSNEVHHIWEAVSPECFTERTALVIPGEEKVEQGDDSTLELWAPAGVDSSGRKGLPNDRFTDVGGNE